MSPLEAITHLFAGIQMADKHASYEEKESWIKAISILFPDYSSERSEIFFNEAHSQLSKLNEIETKDHIRLVLERIKSLFNNEQIEKLGPMIADIVESDGIVMSSEMEIVYLSEKILGISITINDL